MYINIYIARSKRAHQHPLVVAILHQKPLTARVLLLLLLLIFVQLKNRHYIARLCHHLYTSRVRPHMFVA
jgi:hypothetical protein